MQSNQKQKLILLIIKKLISDKILFYLNKKNKKHVAIIRYKKNKNK